MSQFMHFKITVKPLWQPPCPIIDTHITFAMYYSVLTIFLSPAFFLTSVFHWLRIVHSGVLCLVLWLPDAKGVKLVLCLSRLMHAAVVYVKLGLRALQHTSSDSTQKTPLLGERKMTLNPPLFKHLKEVLQLVIVIFHRQKLLSAMLKKNETSLIFWN